VLHLLLTIHKLTKGTHKVYNDKQNWLNSCHSETCKTSGETRSPLLQHKLDDCSSCSQIPGVWHYTGGWLQTPEEIQISTLPSLGYSIWNPWNVRWNPWNFQVDSIPFSGGFHGMVDGFHIFSRWIPYLFQMDSIPFPGWSPYGIIILHLFHTIFRVDSIWNE
jgi:hypothetical protein